MRKPMSKKNEYLWFVDWKGDYHFCGGPFDIEDAIAIIQHYMGEMGIPLIGNCRWFQIWSRGTDLIDIRIRGVDIVQPECLGYYVLIEGEK